MNTDYLTRLMTFTEDDLPDLDEVVMGTLAYLEGISLDSFSVSAHRRPLVVGSGNAVSAAQLLFRNTDAMVVEEGEFESYCARGIYDSVYVVSASGSKHAIDITEKSLKSNLPTYLITSTDHSPAARMLDPDHVFLFPHIREPYTYNTSTYLGMIMGQERTSPERIRFFIENQVAPALPSFGLYRAFLFSLPPEFAPLRRMFETKFHELFGPHLVGQAFTTEEVKHAKTVVTSIDQCFISFGVENRYGAPGFRFTVPVPSDVTAGELLAVGYFIIGAIQKAHRPYFKEHIHAYVKEASAVFDQTVPVIVE